MLLNYCPFRTIKEITETSECFCKPKGNIAIHQQLCFKKSGPALTAGMVAIPGAGLGVLFEDYRGSGDPLK